MARGDFSASFELTMARKGMRVMIEAAGGQPLVVLPAAVAAAVVVARALENGIGRGPAKPIESVRGHVGIW